MNKKSAVAMVIIIGSTAALFASIYSLQYFQSRTTRNITPESAISIVAETQNVTDYDASDYFVRYVNIKGNGTVFKSDLGSNSVGEQIGTAQPTFRGISYFAWEVASKNDNSTYYVDSKSGEVVSKAAR